ncbi:Hsp70 family protein [Nocardioides panacis]|uniref:Hsp70 family protein n=1 Tax=Nocardioides panacis TaxID=2849501 RepID=A0A975T0D9_9ACTN|nr:Hsp70 family protein [Nocardioides panacis]QWZ09236.1 Hsp70 family protein [Nocardioides panacis]
MAKPVRTVGFDFGTSTSLVAEGIPGRPISIVPLGVATRSMPSWVGIGDQGVVSGEAAQDLPLSVVARSVKRAITRRWTTVPLEANPEVNLNADEAIRCVLREMGNRARDRGVVLTDDSVRLGCPAMWTSQQRNRLLRLTREAGVPASDHTLVDEPIAAGVAWVSHRVDRFGDRLKGRLLVFDMGGGTLDVALLDVEAGPRATPEISVLASSGLDEAGDRLDAAIAGDLAQMYGDLGIEIDGYGDATLAAVILHEARRVKEILSASPSAVVAPRHPTITLPSLTYTREQLETAFEAQLRNATRLVEAVLRESLLTNERHPSPEGARALPLSALQHEVRYVLLVGGMSQIPIVARRLGDIFASASVYDDAGVRPDEAIVAGLADTAGYERINLHRPGFDFVLDWPGQDGLPMYEAFTPFYPWWMAMQRSELYYEHTIRARHLPSSGSGMLKIRSSGGSDIALRIDGTDSPGMPVQFGHRDVMLRMYPNGRVVLCDGRGRQHPIKINKWPMLRGMNHAVLVAERISAVRPEDPELPYPHGSRDTK